jgi:molybdate transport system permease protein
MLREEFWQTLSLTAQLAATTTALLLVIGLPIAFALSQTRMKAKPLLEALISMPLVLPPSVLGFYLLLAFSPESHFGAWLEILFWHSPGLYVSGFGGRVHFL